MFLLRLLNIVRYDRYNHFTNHYKNETPFYVLLGLSSHKPISINLRNKLKLKLTNSGETKCYIDIKPRFVQFFSPEM